MRGEIGGESLVDIFNASRNTTTTPSCEATPKISADDEDPRLCAADALEYLRRVPALQALSLRAGGPSNIPKSRNLLSTATKSLMYAAGDMETEPSPCSSTSSESDSLIRHRSAGAAADSAPVEVRGGELTEQDKLTISAAHDLVMEATGLNIFRGIAQAITGRSADGKQGVPTLATNSINIGLLATMDYNVRQERTCDFRYDVCPAVARMHTACAFSSSAGMAQAIQHGGKQESTAGPIDTSKVGLLFAPGRRWADKTARKKGVFRAGFNRESAKKFVANEVLRQGLGDGERPGAIFKFDGMIMGKTKNFDNNGGNHGFPEGIHGIDGVKPRPIDMRDVTEYFKTDLIPALRKTGLTYEALNRLSDFCAKHRPLAEARMATAVATVASKTESYARRLAKSARSGDKPSLPQPPRKKQRTITGTDGDAENPGSDGDGEASGGEASDEEGAPEPDIPQNASRASISAHAASWLIKYQADAAKVTEAVEEFRSIEYDCSRYCDLYPRELVDPENRTPSTPLVAANPGGSAPAGAVLSPGPTPTPLPHRPPAANLTPEGELRLHMFEKGLFGRVRTAAVELEDAASELITGTAETHDGVELAVVARYAVPVTRAPGDEAALARHAARRLGEAGACVSHICADGAHGTGAGQHDLKRGENRPTMARQCVEEAHSRLQRVASELDTLRASAVSPAISAAKTARATAAARDQWLRDQLFLRIKETGMQGLDFAPPRLAGITHSTSQRAAARDRARNMSEKDKAWITHDPNSFMGQTATDYDGHDRIQGIVVGYLGPEEIHLYGAQRASLTLAWIIPQSSSHSISWFFFGIFKFNGRLDRLGRWPFTGRRGGASARALSNSESGARW